MSRSRACAAQRAGKPEAATTAAARMTATPAIAAIRGACACGGGCPRCQAQPRPRPALGDAAPDGEPAAAGAPEASAAAPAPADSATSPGPGAADPAQPLDDGPCTAGGTTITPVDKTITAHGSTVQDAVEDATNRQNGHVASVTPVFAPYVFCPIESSGKTVQAATVAVTETKVVPTWAERGQYPKEAQDMWDRYVAVVDGHENDHLAIDARMFKDMDQKAVGKSPAKARAALDAVVTAADTANTALDNREGCIRLNGGTGRVTKEPRANC